MTVENCAGTRVDVPEGATFASISGTAAAMLLGAHVCCVKGMEGMHMDVRELQPFPPLL